MTATQQPAAPAAPVLTGDGLTSRPSRAPLASQRPLSHPSSWLYAVTHGRGQQLIKNLGFSTHRSHDYIYTVHLTEQSQRNPPIRAQDDIMIINMNVHITSCKTYVFGSLNSQVRR